MKFSRIRIENFRGIRSVTLTDLPDTIVIAGQNGSGKSTVFDAIRLWKSAYAGYQINEVDQWLAEFGLSNGNKPFSRLLQSTERPMTIEASIVLAESEKDWMLLHVDELIREAAYRRLVPNYNQYNPYGIPMPFNNYHRPSELTESMKAQEPNIQIILAEERPQLITELNKPELTGLLSCQADGTATTINNIALARVFGIFDSKNIGIIDYYGPQRTFAREEVGGINLQIQQYEQQRQNNALYNYSGKYGGVKQELASAYVRDLISKEAGIDQSARGLGLSKTIEELFRTFFPGKRFKGVQPSADGSIRFDVETSSGVHDINELSSGEKELLYGYLRLRNYAPSNSIVLIDEPELHLNPRLTDGLTDFYHRHVGKALGNQLWLVTHSDLILRQSVGQDGYKVYHMLTADQEIAVNNQAIEVKAEGDVAQAVLDIVGNLAAYKPGAKLVFIEGGGTRSFDEALITDLFPEFAAEHNIIPSGSKSRVRQIGDLLGKARAQDPSLGQAFSITDGDNEDLSFELPANCFRWDRYHIENYLLEPEFIAKVLIELRYNGSLDLQHDALLSELRSCAEQGLDDMVRHEVQLSTRRALSPIISLEIDRDGNFSAKRVFDKLNVSLLNFNRLLTTTLSERSLTQNETTIRARFQQELNNNGWVKTFKGREILKNFNSKHLNGVVRYEVFRDLILARMRDAGFRPSGVAQVLAKVGEITA